MCECTDMSLDMKTPRNIYLSAFYKRSFAYHTVKNRMPVIITQLLDTLTRNKDSIVAEFGENSREDLKQVIGELSKFKYEVQTNKPLTKLVGEETDVRIYNDYIAKQASEEGETTHFNTIWLLAECYMYKRIKEMFTLTATLKDFDYFKSSKTEQYNQSIHLMDNLSQLVVDIIDNHETCDRKQAILKMLKLNLWGNKCDLSISLGKVEGPGQLHDIKALDQFILADDSEKIYQALITNDNNNIIDIVLDNSGYEVFTDLCLMDILTTFSLAKKIRFHVKAIPWFISDVMEKDFLWTLQQSKDCKNSYRQQLGSRWTEYLANGQWQVMVHHFWTCPYEFKFMSQFAPDLYELLTESKLVIFKGDLNYRKLFGEKNWDPTLSPEEALQGFLPAKLCTLRTIKADIVVGLKPGQAEICHKTDEKWMEKGDYGLIQFMSKLPKNV
ncbi:unnamed protein product [Ceutorhynchus assimilis]|uniref:Sugar phosphate phosphatase n=1 Tax=Ceutorhynchus assimilis TaxID=467358 RepID=A0A9N9MGC0_9CUCU|nr:unnamed protein product [Ceutorhynchus assimilis]